MIWRVDRQLPKTENRSNSTRNWDPPPNRRDRRPRRHRLPNRPALRRLRHEHPLPQAHPIRELAYMKSTILLDFHLFSQIYVQGFTKRFVMGREKLPIAVQSLLERSVQGDTTEFNSEMEITKMLLPQYGPYTAAGLLHQPSVPASHTLGLQGT